MKEDFTHYLLTSSLFFVIGLCIYFLLSVFKVHIIRYIQPRLHDPRYQKSLFNGYFANFFNVVFSSKRLFGPTLQYIFNKKKFEIQFLNFDYYVYPGLIFGSIMTVLTFFLTYKLYAARTESDNNFNEDMWSLAWYLFNSCMFCIIGFIVFIQNT